jgi:hypothetical protein
MGRRAQAVVTAVKAASMTYNRCAGLIAEACGVDVLRGEGPKETFELTVLHIRRMIEQGDSKPSSQLTMDDFSFNQVLDYMRLTAEHLSIPGWRTIDRQEFIREVIKTLEVCSGLEKKKVYPNAVRGHYRWVDHQMRTFLHRNKDVITRRSPDRVTIRPRRHGARRRPESVQTAGR